MIYSELYAIYDFFSYKMAQDNILCLKELPYYSVLVLELKKDFGNPIMTKADYINNDLDDVRNLYHSDLLQNLNFDYLHQIPSTIR